MGDLSKSSFGILSIFLQLDVYHILTIKVMLMSNFCNEHASTLLYHFYVPFVQTIHLCLLLLDEVMCDKRLIDLKYSELNSWLYWHKLSRSETRVHNHPHIMLIVLESTTSGNKYTSRTYFSSRITFR